MSMATKERQYEYLPPRGAKADGTVSYREYVESRYRADGDERVFDRDGRICEELVETNLHSHARRTYAPRVARKVTESGYSLDDALDFLFWDLLRIEMIHPDDCSRIVSATKGYAEKEIKEIQRRRRRARR